MPLLETLRLARSRQGFCAPNPAVGAVLVRDGQIVARGRHHGPGHPHAEVEALRGAGDLAGATLYVSLEPCCHTGKRTPPCAAMLIERGVQRLVFAHADPNPLVSGRGEAMLRAAGIACERISHPEIDEFYAPYRFWTQRRRPFVTAKLALTLDGKIGLTGGLPHAITGERLREVTHRGRREADAILTTARTVRADDPALNCRLDPTAPIAKPVYVLDARAETPPTARLFNTASLVTVFVAEDSDRAQRLAARGARIIIVPFENEGLDLGAVLDRIGADGRHSLWVEAGGKLFETLHRHRLLQKALLYVAPKWLGAAGASAFGEAADLFSTARAIGWRGEGPYAICEVRW